MGIKFDKPFLRYDQLITLMRSRNIIVDDKQFAMNVLSNISYYTIVNGYKDSFLSIPGTDSFIPGTKFEELYTLHTLDVAIGNLVLKNILYIERSLKSRLSYLVSRKYGIFTDPKDYTHTNPDDYLFRGNYSNGKKRNSTLKQLTETLDITDKGKYKSNSLKYYIQNHNHVPPWILTTSLTLGQTILWYSILSPPDKMSICNSYVSGTTLSNEEKKEYIHKAFDLLKEFRNNNAHGSRTFQSHGAVAIPKQQLIMLSHGIIGSQDYNSNPFAQSGLFAVIAVITTLLNDKYLLASFYKDLDYTLRPYAGIEVHGKTVMELFNLPDNLLDRMTQAIT